VTAPLVMSKVVQRLQLKTQSTRGGEFCIASSARARCPDGTGMAVGGWWLRVDMELLL
jgi:hypothetical protein